MKLQSVCVRRGRARQTWDCVNDRHHRVLCCVYPVMVIRMMIGSLWGGEGRQINRWRTAKKKSIKYCTQECQCYKCQQTVAYKSRRTIHRKRHITTTTTTTAKKKCQKKWQKRIVESGERGRTSLVRWWCTMAFCSQVWTSDVFRRNDLFIARTRTQREW